MNIPEKIFKAYDIRGIYPDEINEENIVSIVRSIYKFFQAGEEKPLKIVISRDMRTHSPSLHKVAIQTLIECGADIIDIGIVSTPTFYYSVYKYKPDGGFQISASHNPKEYNGVKLVKYSTNGLIKIGKPSGMEDVKNGAINGVEIAPAEPGKVTEINTEELLAEEVQNALDIVGHPEIKEFKIVADPANAMGSQYIDALFKQTPGNLVRMNFELDGTFPVHQADPLQPETLVDLKKRVVEENADLGLAPDGDGDRLFFIDEKGEIIPATTILSLLANELLENSLDKKVVVDIKNILNAKSSVEQSGGELVISETGHAYITKKMGEVGALFGGETSGHFYFKSTGNAESQMPVILTVLKVLTRSGKSLSEVAKAYRRAYESGEINFKVSNALEILEALKEKYSDGELDTLDGVSFAYSDWRFNVRISNTEPLLRLNVEEANMETAGNRVGEIVRFIESIAIFEEEK